MNQTITVKITGLDDLQKQLEAIPRAVANKILRTTLKEAGEELKAEMMLEVDKDTGFLSEHLVVETTIRRKEVSGVVQVGPAAQTYYPGVGREMFSTKTGRRLVATGKYPTKGAQVPVASVARFLEFGTHKEGKHPFMTTSFEMLKERLLQKIIDGIRSALAQVRSK